MGAATVARLVDDDQLRRPQQLLERCRGRQQEPVGPKPGGDIPGRPTDEFPGVHHFGNRANVLAELAFVLGECHGSVIPFLFG